MQSQIEELAGHFIEYRVWVEHLSCSRKPSDESAVRAVLDRARDQVGATDAPWLQHGHRRHTSVDNAQDRIGRCSLWGGHRWNRTGRFCGDMLDRQDRRQGHATHDGMLIQEAQQGLMIGHLVATQA